MNFHKFSLYPIILLCTFFQYILHHYVLHFSVSISEEEVSIEVFKHQVIVYQNIFSLLQIAHDKAHLDLA